MGGGRAPPAPTPGVLSGSGESGMGVTPEQSQRGGQGGAWTVPGPVWTAGQQAPQGLGMGAVCRGRPWGRAVGSPGCVAPTSLEGDRTGCQELGVPAAAPQSSCPLHQSGQMRWQVPAPHSAALDGGQWRHRPGESSGQGRSDLWSKDGNWEPAYRGVLASLLPPRAGSLPPGFHLAAGGSARPQACSQGRSGPARTRSCWLTLSGTPPGTLTAN